MKCENCNREAKMFWKDKSHLNGHSETFWTAPDGKQVCIDCLIELTGRYPKTLQELNNERKQKPI